MDNNLHAVSSLKSDTSSGFYSYHTPADAPLQYRLHLRILPDENGLLILNAATIMHLNKTGTYFAWAKMQTGSEEEALQLIQKQYKANATLLRNDYRAFMEEIERIIQNPDQAPMATSADYNSADSEEHLKIPMRANLCLTYRRDPEDSIDSSEKLTADWKQKIKTAFDAGIPQILFFGGEPTLREDFPELLAYTEELGQVSGLITASKRIIQEPAFVQKLIELGLDHLVLEVDPKEVNPVDLKHIFDQDLFTCIRIKVSGQYDFLKWALEIIDLGANAINIYPAEIWDSQKTAELHQQLVKFDINLEHDLPFPLTGSKDAAPKLFSPDVNEVGPETSLIYLPDGSLSPESAFKPTIENIDL